jgi:hypothetical protein
VFSRYGLETHEFMSPVLLHSSNQRFSASWIHPLCSFYWSSMLYLFFPPFLILWNPDRLISKTVRGLFPVLLLLLKLSLNTPFHFPKALMCTWRVPSAKCCMEVFHVILDIIAGVLGDVFISIFLSYVSDSDRCLRSMPILVQWLGLFRAQDVASSLY